MKRATKAEHDAVIFALAAMSNSDGAEESESYRAAAYNALYELAIARVIPPEINISVTVDEREAGAWALRFTDDFVEWLG